MNELLHSAAGVISRWLEEKLPQLGTDWWSEKVVNQLTFQQQRLVESKRTKTLSELDLAAVLRVLDRNWSEISVNDPLPRECKIWVKELQNVRNRWAHAPAGGLSSADKFRDADTLERILRTFNADEELCSRVDALKNTVMVSMVPPRMYNATEGVDAGEEDRFASANLTSDVQSSYPFNLGQLVCLRSNPSAVFPVLEILPGAGTEARYKVFENGTRKIYYESQLSAIGETEDKNKHLTARDLSALLSSVYLSSPSASALYSLNSGRVRFVPYQYRPVFKLIRADRPRILVADEVGVGKTIEAGLILKELQARNEIKSVLIICPKALVSERKWELEMKRFDEHFIPLNGPLLRHCIKETHLSGEWPMQYEKAILPTSLFDNDILFGKAGKSKSRDIGLLELEPAPKFDLVIVDEAHHIRNSETYLHQAVRYFADNAEAVVFLSATPVQLGREDLFTLLNVLRPDLIIDQVSFNQMAEPNQFINHAIQACRRDRVGWAKEVREQLRVIAETTWGKEVLSMNPGFQHIYDKLDVDGEHDAARIETIQALEELYTFSSLINRTRRRDIGEFTTRKAETLTTYFTPSQKKLHDDLLSVIARILGRLHGNQNVKFMMTTICRQAASSLYGLAPALKEMLEGKLSRLEAEETAFDDNVDDHSHEYLEEIRGDIESLIVRAKTLDSNDPKADAFIKVVKDKIGMNQNKVLAFSTFRHTLYYLVGKLNDSNIRYGLVHGGVSDEERSTLRKRFSLHKDEPDALDVLLSSEVGCEGLDFQFCDCLINIDLPWNPMRIEQRIGRIDRYGQLSETVAIINLVTAETIDAEIYDRCLSRIGVFQHAIGGTEEILGDITTELNNIAQNFNLSEQEREARLNQLSDNKIRLISEEQRLEERQGELFGLNIAAASWEKKLNSSRNYWLEPQALSIAVTAYLSRRLEIKQEYLLGDKPLKTLRLNQEARASLLIDFRKLSRSTDPTHRDWEKWLKGPSPTLSVTFEQECAVENDSAVLLSLGHPLLRQASLYLQQDDAAIVSLVTEHETLPIGHHYFALYRWTKQGIRQDELLVPISTNQALSSCLMELLPLANDTQEKINDAGDRWDELDAFHHGHWLTEATKHGEDTRQLVAAKIQSLTASFAARKVILAEHINRASNEKIRLMKQAELERAKMNFERQILTLQESAKSGDIRATPIVFGVIEVRRPV